MKYDQVYEKDFVMKTLLEAFDYQRRDLIDKIMTHIWDAWIPGTTLEFEHEFWGHHPFRDSILSQMVKEFGDKGWSLAFERLGALSKNKLRVTVS